MQHPILTFLVFLQFTLNPCASFEQPNASIASRRTRGKTQVLRRRSCTFPKHSSKTIQFLSNFYKNQSKWILKMRNLSEFSNRIERPLWTQRRDCICRVSLNKKDRIFSLDGDTDHLTRSCRTSGYRTFDNPFISGGCQIGSLISTTWHSTSSQN